MTIYFLDAGQYFRRRHRRLQSPECVTMIDWLTKRISKNELVDNNNKEVKRSKEEEQNLDTENKHDYIRSNERIHYIDDYY